MPFQVTVEGFPEGGSIPKQYTCDGQDRSPAVRWSGAPPGVKSFALIMDDPDAPGGTWTHWLLYDIPASMQSLPEGTKHGEASHDGLSGKNDFNRLGYGGPCPPKRHGPHRYFFKVFALDVSSLGLPAGAGRAQVDRALKGHVLAEAQYMGRYERK
jgi:Raf kinase inhibitor-like YbhB/YbcL family protein